MAPLTARRRITACLLCIFGLMFFLVPSSAAASLDIDFVDPVDDELQILISLSDPDPGVVPDLDSVEVSLDGNVLSASATPVAEAATEVSRTAILAIDVSQSMSGPKFAAAQEAARTFLDVVPDDISVGLVTFASEVEVIEEPTNDLEAIRTSLDGLGLTRKTRLFDGARAAVEAAGTGGARSVLLLTDGADTSKTSLDETLTAIADSGVQVDVVGLGQNARNLAVLEEIAQAGNGAVVATARADALTAVFASQAQSLAQQVLVTVPITEDLGGAQGNLSIAVVAAGERLTDTAFVAIPALASEVVPVTPPAAQTTVAVPEWMLTAGIAGIGLGIAVITFMVFGGAAKDSRQDEVDQSIHAYTRKGSAALANGKGAADSQSVTKSAVSVAENVLASNENLQGALDDRLEGAGVAFRAAEWLLLHFGIAIGLGLFGLLLTNGSLVYMLVGLFLGAVGPWLFLSFKRKRRLAAFKAQLADTLQMLAGSLSAGLSLQQSIDTVVQEGADPMATEFRRALIETRLGVTIDDALMGVAERMDCEDFEWVVMAIRIQRDVGGNLSELLNTVSATIREREYLERQVIALSAEGRLSVRILAGLPVVFLLYLVLTSPDYVAPLFNSALGLLMLGTMTVLLVVGVFWMRKVVKVEV